MKAVICTKYGPPDVLQLGEIATPSPKNSQVRIKIHTTAVTASDCIVRGFKIRKTRPRGILAGIILGFNKPRNPIFGLVFAGEVDSVGKNVTRFKTGDPVFGFTGFSGGTYAEYKCMSEKRSVAIKPSNLTYEEAVALPYGGLLAMSFLKKASIQRGQKVLIYGASGAIGTAAVQLVKHFGAEVTGVCSAANLDLVKSLGADQVIDYTAPESANQTASYDFIFDAVGRRKSSAFKEQCQQWLAPNGKYLSVDDGFPKTTLEDLLLLKELAEAGTLKPVIDRCYPLEQIVEATEYVEQGHKKGNVVITM